MIGCRDEHWHVPTRTFDDVAAMSSERRHRDDKRAAGEFTSATIL